MSIFPEEARDLSAKERACVSTAVDALFTMAASMEREAVALGRLDAVAGDGDHGRGMVRGTRAALEAARAAREDGADVGAVLVAAGAQWAAQAGGTSGVLWGAALRALGGRLSGSAPITPELVAAAVTDAYEAVERLGKAARGDKTMLDAFWPFADALRTAVARGQALSDAWGAAAKLASSAAQETAPLRPRIGRARQLAERSVGSPDPGATSLAVCLEAVAEVLRAAQET